MSQKYCEQCHQPLPESTSICAHCNHSKADQRHHAYAVEVMNSNQGKSGAWRLLMILYSLGVIVAIGLLFTGYWKIAVLVLIAMIIISFL